MSGGIGSAHSRLKVAELTSGIGAGVLGLGLGARFSDHLKSFSVLIIVIGLFAHALGMFDKHRIEKEGEVFPPVWTKFVYWICWAGIVGLIVYLIFLQRGDL